MGFHNPGGNYSLRMKYINRHNRQRQGNSPILWLLLLLLCLSACSSDKGEIPVQPTTVTKLYVYVYAPRPAQPTRAAYDGDVNAILNESAVYALQIWVFGHTSHNLLGYYASTQPSSLSTSEPYELIQMTIDETFAETEAASREHVDVYVAANVANSNCNVELDGQMTQAQLEAALIQKTTVDPFGVTAPVSVVPENVGLPMSGVVRDLPVTGTAPVLRLDNSGQIARVQLIRTVSKLRFAFSRQTGGETLRVNSIKLNTEMLPIAQYIFMDAAAPYDRRTCHIKTDSGYESATPNLLNEAVTEIAENEDPVIYAWGYDEATPEVYEARIETAVASGLLTQRYFYLRESDKLITGEIKYQVGDGDEQTATFTMVDDGTDDGFSRNHVWTIYSYLAEAKLKLIVAEVAPWKQTETNYEFYNW